MRVKAILDNELLNGIEIEKDTITEVDDLLGDYLLRAYGDRWEKVDDDVEDEKDEKDEGENKDDDEEKDEKKSTKKSK